MPTIFAACITILFTVWVWSLKHELESVRKHQLGVVGGLSLAAPSVVEHQHHVAMALPKRPVAQAAHAVAHATTTETVHPRGGVIPTWTIEG